jgi:hypothetical protein
MTDSIEAVQAYAEAVQAPGEETIGRLATHLAPGAAVVGILGGAAGKDAILAALASPDLRPFLRTATWAEPAPDDGRLSLRATLSGAAVGGMAFWFSFDGEGRITRVDQEIMPAPLPEPGPIELGPEIKANVDGALANGTPALIAYVDPQGAPHISPRGTTQVFSSDQLATWARDPEGGLLKGIAVNPLVSVFYRDAKTRTSYHFIGRARPSTDPAVRETVFENSPEIERNLDPRRRGVAVLIDVDRVEGSGPSGRILMERR